MDKWHSRGYLPHFESGEVVQHATLHLADSLPLESIKRWTESLNRLPLEQRDAEHRKRLELLLDAGYGSCVLQERAIASMVQSALLHFDGERHRMIEWVVMPNHVHVLLQMINGWELGKVVGSWKKFTAARIVAHRKSLNGNNVLDKKTLEDGGSKTGNLDVCRQPVWHREYWDRFVRNEEHLKNVVKYIHRNPVSAGLVERAEQWEWGSAFWSG